MNDGSYLFQAASCPSLWRIGRNRDYSPVQTAEKAGEKLQVGRIDEQSTRSKLYMLLEPGANHTGLTIQVTISQTSAFYFSIDQESIRFPLRMLVRSVVKEFYECRSLKEWV